MKYILLMLLVSFQLYAQNGKYALAIHGGAGSIVEGNFTEEEQKAYEDMLLKALKAGEAILAEGGSAEEAVVKSISMLEESPLFNAGKGAVMTWDTVCELDASIMRGKDRMAGAVAGVSLIKSPIAAAQAVMNKSVHVMLSGEGAEEFARDQKLEMVTEGYFETEQRRKVLERHKKTLKTGSLIDSLPDWKYGTVGCVALDKDGNLAAGTSTGGMTAKRYGRIGDSPIIGAGTYAHNNTAAISCTGHGEFFIRYAVAYDVTALMEYGNLSLKQAADSVIFGKLEPVAGTGGLIAIDREGNITMPFNTKGMFRGSLREGEAAIVKMYKE